MARHGWILILLASLGCSKAGNPPPAVAEESKPSAEAEPRIAAATFAEAVTETSPEEQQPPPDHTLNGLATAKLRERVQSLWDQVTFVSPAGKPLECTATLETDQ